MKEFNIRWKFNLNSGFHF